MPIPQEQLKRLDEDIDRRLKQTDPKQFQESPSSAPSALFADSPPKKIHGEGREDQDFWGPPKSKPPIPIEHI